MSLTFKAMTSKVNYSPRIVLMLVIALLLIGNVFAADRYWVGGSGYWTTTNTTNWSASSGGPGGQSVPTSSDNVYFDLNSSPNHASYFVNISGIVDCLNLIIDGPDSTDVNKLTFG